VSLQELKDKMAIDLYGMTAQEARAQGRCVQCKNPAEARCYSEAGRREYQISGLCEKCFDEICGAENEE
jgi:hypothetical protein